MCFDCTSDEENRHGLCDDCQDYWRKRARAGIRNKYHTPKSEEEETQQAGLGDFT